MKRTLLTTLITTAVLMTTLAGLPATAAAEEFCPASTLKQAETVAQQTYNYIAYKSPRRYGNSIPEHQRLERLNAINREVSRVEATYNIKLPRVNILHLTDSNRGFYSYRRDEIIFSTTRLAHTLRHEFAHVIDHRLGVTGREWKQLVEKMKDTYHFSPSEYANTNLEEYWAEAFAYFTAPGYGTSDNRFPAELETFITNVIDQLERPVMLVASTCR
ncbi:hypothetical protein CR163_010740 [Prosthecochloris sp. ZM_2]|uniref:hypothetical protein n=1 Tax=Prosthecochloris sp. ZM_2 TaxID=2045206 RepID=UPI000DF78E7C|nr:hypothetical protein [Prosthecochloris sp. ZM_2]RNA65644.1 hypothetical protein CR163_010740 [Prosthecochloris sp. ZM_2]